MGIYSIKKVATLKAKGKEKGVGVGIRASYLRVVGIQVDTEGAGKDGSRTLTRLSPGEGLSEVKR